MQLNHRILAIAGDVKVELQLVCSAQPQPHQEITDSIIAHFRQSCLRIRWYPEAPVIETNQRGQLEVRFCWAVDTHCNEDEVFAQFNQLLETLARLSSDYELNWKVGHALEPDLGTISEGCIATELLAELRTAVTVARSLSPMIVDDEFVDDLWAEEEIGDGEHQAFGTHPLTAASDDCWTELLEPDASFTRFPELE
jgi:hypothetical protein